MKKFLSIFIAIITAFCAFALTACKNKTLTDAYTEILGDPTFAGGINIDSTGNGNDANGRKKADYMGTVNSETFWSYAQHTCRLSTRNGQEKKDGDWYIYTDSQVEEEVSKTLKVNPKTGAVTLNCDASKDYEKPRESGNDPWLHMLLGQGFYDEYFVADMEELILDISFTLNVMENLMGDAYNPSFHAAQLQLFFVVKSANPGEANAGLWFGMPFYDNRDTALSAPNGGFDRGTNMYISSMGTAAYMTELATVGKKTVIKHNLVPEIEKALKHAQNLGYMQSTSFEDLYLVNMNIGWEIPGIFNAGVDIHNFNLKAKYAQ